MRSQLAPRTYIPLNRSASSVKQRFAPAVSFDAGHAKPGIEGAIFYDLKVREPVVLDKLTISELYALVGKPNL